MSDGAAANVRILKQIGVAFPCIRCRITCMSSRVLKEIRTAVANLNPGEVQTAAGRSLSIGLVASSASAFDAIEEFLLPSDRISFRKRAEASDAVVS